MNLLGRGLNKPAATNTDVDGAMLAASLGRRSEGNMQRSESGWPNMGVASIRSPKSLLGDSSPESLARLMLVELEVQMAGK